jgi:hypothetical protein
MSLYDAIGKSDWDEATIAVRRNPIEAQTWVRREESKFLPLHSACARHPPSSFVFDLIEAYPEAVQSKDDSGMLPLHYACGNRASKAVIELLLSPYPHAAQEADPQGMLPIHYVAQWGPSQDGVVESLMNAFAEGALMLNFEGKSPLELCEQANYDGWENIYALMERHYDFSRRGGVPQEISAKSPISSSVSRRERDRESRKIMPFSFDEEIDAKRAETSSILRSAKSPRSSRDWSQEVEHYRTDSSKPSSILRKERAASYDHSDQLDRRDEGSTPRATGESYESLTSSREINIAAIATSHVSPRHFDMVTPRSSGRGRRSPSAFQFGQTTPRSPYRVAFDCMNDSNTHSNDLNQQRNRHHQSLMNMNVEFLANENMELRAKLADYELIQKENTQLRAKLVKMQEVQRECSRLFGMCEDLAKPLAKP